MDLDQQTQAVLAVLNGSGVLPFHQFDPVTARARLLGLRPDRSGETPLKMARVWEEQVPAGDGGFTVRVLQPRATAEGETMPVVIYFHGGGFFAGDIDSTDMIVREIAAKSDVIVVNVDYRLAPEAKFPAAPDDAYAALTWVVDNATRLSVDPDRIVLCGDSAGGNLTIVTCLTARDRGGPAIRFQAPIYPSVDLRRTVSYESRRKFGGGEYFLIADDITWMLENYYRDWADGEDWRASPILAESFAGLPPALVVTAGYDPLVDEGKLYADRLRAAGVEVEYACFEDTIHGFVSFASVIPSGARALALICERISAAVSRNTHKNQRPSGKHS